METWLVAVLSGAGGGVLVKTIEVVAGWRQRQADVAHVQADTVRVEADRVGSADVIEAQAGYVVTMMERIKDLEDKIDGQNAKIDRALSEMKHWRGVAGEGRQAWLDRLEEYPNWWKDFPANPFED